MTTTSSDNTGGGSDICRVCRSESTTDQPLFYPCRCSGSIKYIHQDCLVEWLKHSKKKRCELCKHPFTFASIYSNDMPQRIPFLVLMVALFRQVFRTGRLGGFWLVAGSVWFLGVPLATTQISRYYFGFSLKEYFLRDLLGSSAVIASDGFDDYPLDSTLGLFLDVLQGVLISALTVLLILGLLLVREYLASLDRETRLVSTTRTASRNNQAQLDGDLNPPSTTSANGSLLSESVPSPVSPMSPMSPISLSSTVSSEAAPTSPVSSGYWLDQVHPKEYRNYLRRRELHRQRLETITTAANSFAEDQDESAAVAFNDPFVPLLLPEDHLSNVSGTSTLRSRATATTDLTSYSLRCRVCHSTTCINRDHVVQASQMRNSITAQRNLSLLQRQQVQAQEPEHVQTPSSASADPSGASLLQPTQAPQALRPPTDYPPPTPAAANPELAAPTQTQTPAVDAFDGVESISISEFFGFTSNRTSLFQLLQHACISIGVNAIMMHVFLLIPMLMGGLMLSVTGKLLHFISILWLSSNLPAKFPMSVLFTSKSWFHVITATSPSFLVSLATGYFGLSVVVSLYSKLTSGLRDAFNRSVNSAFRLIGTFFKVSSMLSLEMIGFPLLCGWCIDYFTVGLFPDPNSFSNRLALATTQQPLTMFVIHWALGILFMFTFAAFVGFIRTFSRPGLLFFLRNPLDPDYNPVREMFQRGLVDQVARLSFSLLFYLVLIGVSVGSSAQLATVILSPFRVLPLRLSFSDPLIEIPIDILLHLLLRSIWTLWSPKRLLSRAFQAIFNRSCSMLSLSSWILGRGRYIPEEAVPRHGRWQAVPNFDRVYTRPRLHELLDHEVTPLEISRLPTVIDRSGLPVSATAAESSPRTAADWTVAYRPHGLKLRLLALFGMTAAVCQGILVTGLLAPLFLGRWLLFILLAQVLSVTASTHVLVHDYYAWTLGAICLLALLRASDLLLQPSASSTTTAGSQPTRRFSRNLIVQGITRFSVIGLFVLGVWPLLVGILVACVASSLLELDSASSFSSSQFPSTTPVIMLLSCWSLGFPVLRIAWWLRRHLPLRLENLAALEALMRDDWRSESWNLGKFIVSLGIPLTISLLSFIFIPPIMVAVLAPLVLGSLSHEEFVASVMIYQNRSHLTALLTFFLWRLIRTAQSSYQRVMSGIRDEAYLVGRQLQNLDDQGRSASNHSQEQSNHPPMSPIL